MHSSLWGDILGFHFIEALNDNLEAYFFFAGSFLHPIRYSDNIWDHAAQFFFN